MAVTVRHITTPGDLDALFELPMRLYANDEAWVAPLQMIEKRRLRPDNAFFEGNQLVLFLAERDGVVVGSISALRDRGFEKSKEQRVAWFGFFECVEDDEVAAALLDAAVAQARAWGATHLRGPRNLTRFEFMGLTVEGHHRRPPFLQGHHPAWYAGLLERQGLTKHHDVLAYETPIVDDMGNLRSLPEALQAKADACDVPDLVVRSAQRLRLRRDLVACHEVLNEAFETVPDVAPMPLRQWLALGRIYLTFANVRMISIAFSGDEAVGFAACFPELNEAVAPMQGRVLPAGWLRSALAVPQVHTATFKLIGVKQRFRGSGVHAKLIEHIIEGCREAGYTRLEASVIDERNKPMRAVVEHAGMTIYRRYRFFEREV